MTDEELEKIKEEEGAETQTANPEAQEQQEPMDDNQMPPASEDGGLQDAPKPTVEDENQIAVENNEVQPQPRMFSQDELNEIVGKTRIEARDKANASFLERYGVADDNELNDLVGRGQSYSYLDEQYKNADAELKQLRIENALLKSGIVPERYEDAKLIITGKGLDVNEQTIAQELLTHPEWGGNIGASAPVSTTAPAPMPNKVFTRQMAESVVNTPNQPMQQPQEQVVRKFGNPVSETDNNSEADEEARALRYMGF